MRVFSLYILSFLIFAASFQSSLLLVDYKINSRFYELHCINQNRPELDCHGKCELTKESQKGSTLFKLVQIGFEFHFLKSEDLQIMPMLSGERKKREKIRSHQHLFSQPSLRVLTAPPQSRFFC